MIGERYQAQVLNVEWWVVGGRTSTEDIIQETFLSAYRGIGEFRGGSLIARLFCIGSNLEVDLMRVSKRRPEESLDEPFKNPAFQIASLEEFPEQPAIRGGLADHIRLYWLVGKSWPRGPISGD